MNFDEWDRYCKQDLDLTRDLYITVGRRNGKTARLNAFINKKLEEQKMKNITWKVEDLTAIFNSNVGEDDRIEVDLVGYVGPKANVADLPNMAKMIELKMNSQMDVASLYPTIPKLRVTTTPNPDTIIPKIKDVIFNGPATIVLWKDGTKTVVKAQEGEIVDYEKGLAMAISKRMLGNKGSYYDTFTKYLPKEEA